MNRIALGDESSFSQLLDRHWLTVYVHALMYLKVAEAAEELTQDIFVDIWVQRKKLPALENFRNYLFIIARNKTFSQLRKRIRRIDREGLQELEEKLYIPDSQLHYKELNEQLIKAIDQLPPKRKMVFTMSRVQGLSHNEIAENLHISKQTVNEHIMEALQFLKTFLRNLPERRIFLFFMTIGIFILK